MHGHLYLMRMHGASPRAEGMDTAPERGEGAEGMDTAPERGEGAEGMDTASERGEGAEGMDTAPERGEGVEGMDTASERGGAYCAREWGDSSHQASQLQQANSRPSDVQLNSKPATWTQEGVRGWVCARASRGRTLCHDKRLGSGAAACVAPAPWRRRGLAAAPHRRADRLQKVHAAGYRRRLCACIRRPGPCRDSASCASHASARIRVHAATRRGAAVAGRGRGLRLPASMTGILTPRGTLMHACIVVPSFRDSRAVV
jgi:hypothetical protein